MGRPGGVPAFVVAQVLGGMSSFLLRWLTPVALKSSRDDIPVVVRWRPCWRSLKTDHPDAVLLTEH